MNLQEMTCAELVELITEYVEGALPMPDRVRFEQHLGSCRGCRAYFEQMQQTIRTLGRLTEDTIPPPARDELLQVFRNWKQSERPR